MMKSLGKRYSEIKSNKKSGFTLMELIVVMGVMAVLALIMVPNLTAYINTAEESKNKANVKSVHLAAELAVQTNTDIRVSELTEASTIAQDDVLPEIIEYANVSNVAIVDDAAGASGYDTFYVYPNGDKIVVQYTAQDGDTPIVFNGVEFQ